MKVVVTDRVCRHALVPFSRARCVNFEQVHARYPLPNATSPMLEIPTRTFRYLPPLWLACSARCEPHQS